MYCSDQASHREQLLNRATYTGHWMTYCGGVKPSLLRLKKAYPPLNLRGWGRGFMTLYSFVAMGPWMHDPALINGDGPVDS
jgi:hypothetical protein